MPRRNRDEKARGGPAGGPVVPVRRVRLLTLVLLFCALALVIDAVAGDRGWIANSRDQRQIERAQQDLAAKRRENADLTDYRDRVKRMDPATLEEIARRAHGLIRPGEKLFILKDAQKVTK
jgi:cell division protein FtsB